MCTSVFDSEKTFTYLRGFAKCGEMHETMRAMNFAREKHEGQFRKSGDPYIVHPLIMANNALCLGFREDILIAQILLHDVCEDCGVAPEDLPVGEEVRRGVALLTFTVHSGETKEEAKERYYKEIRQSREAVIAKLLDRCHNVSSMAGTFSEDKLKAYIEETRKYVYPLLRWAKENYPEYSNAFFLIKYHMTSVVDSVAATLTACEDHRYLAKEGSASKTQDPD